MKETANDISHHITSSNEWELAKSKKVYKTDSLQDDGFIHCSTKEQVLGVANELFAGRKDLVLLCIEPALVRSRIEYEDRSYCQRERRTSSWIA